MPTLENTVKTESKKPKYRGFQKPGFYAITALSFLLGSRAYAQQIAFVSERDGNAEIYGVEADGKNLRNITNNPDWDTSPSWSPDGRYLAFASKREGKAGLYIFDTLEGKISFLGSEGTGVTASWSGDGKKIVYEGRDHQIYVLPLQQNLTNGIMAFQESKIGIGSNPKFSPDGKKIAYIAPDKDTGKGPQIWVMDDDGKNQMQVTREGDNFSLGGWSPDGEWIVYVYDTKTVKGGQSPYQIRKIKADGSGIEILTNGSGTDSSPRWSPDGKQIAFVSNRDGNGGVYVMDADGKNLRKLADKAGAAAWLSDGRIAYVSTQDGNWDVYVMNPDSSNKVRLTDNPAKDYAPTPQPKQPTQPPQDTTPPIISNFDPLENSRDNPINRAIKFAVADTNLDSIILEVNGKRHTFSNVTTDGSNTLKITYQPPQPYGYGKRVDVNISAKDKHGNTAIKTFSFFTELPPWDKNKDGTIDIFDLVEESRRISEGSSDIFKLVEVATHLGEEYNDVRASPPRNKGSLWKVDKKYMPTVKEAYNSIESIRTDDARLKAEVEIAKYKLQRIIEYNSAKKNENVLFQNFPNPFNPETWINFRLAKDSKVEAYVWDQQGRPVKHMNLGWMQAGDYIDKKGAYWDGTNQAGEKLASGTYFYTLKAGNWTSTKKMLLLK